MPIETQIVSLQAALCPTVRVASNHFVVQSRACLFTLGVGHVFPIVIIFDTRLCHFMGPIFVIFWDPSLSFLGTHLCHFWGPMFTIFKFSFRWGLATHLCHFLGPIFVIFWDPSLSFSGTHLCHFWGPIFVIFEDPSLSFLGTHVSHFCGPRSAATLQACCCHSWENNLAFLFHNRRA